MSDSTPCSFSAVSGLSKRISGANGTPLKSPVFNPLTYLLAISTLLFFIHLLEALV